MTFWLQHGQGKGDRIDELIQRNAIDGIVLSPAHESADSLAATVAIVRRAKIPASLDPQTYVYSIAGGSGRFHQEHGVEFKPIHWSIDPAEIERQVGQVIRTNDDLGTTGPLIAPSVLQRGFGDSWTVPAFQYAQVAARMAPDRLVLASLVVEDAALGNWTEIEAWLDVATTLKVTGFYVVVARDAPTYPIAWDSQRLANLMRLTYRLTQLNGYQLVLGYGDLDGLGVLAAGASGLASGWHYSLRVFRSSRWVPGGFGRAPLPRVTSRPLLTPINARGEGDLILTTALAAAVFPDAQVRRFLAGGIARWTNNLAHLHHLLELSAAARDLASRPNVRDRVESLHASISSAQELLSRVARAGVPLSPAYRPRLDSMADALREFRRTEGF